MCTISLFTISAPKMSQCTFTLLLSVLTDQTGFWVGLSDENQESVFRWLNGDVLMYNEWGRQPDEPQGGRDGELRRNLQQGTRGCFLFNLGWSKTPVFWCWYVLCIRCILCIVTGYSIINGYYTLIWKSGKFVYRECAI